MNSGVRVSQVGISVSDSAVVVEFKEEADDIFAFKYQRGEKLIIGACEWCNMRNIMKSICKCKNVKYCNDSCMEKDKRFHIPKCSAQADKELVDDDEEEEAQFGAKARKGLVGLTNLGNTCYMNSSIQCLSNTFELTQFFLMKKYKSLVEREWKNPLGTEGRMVLAWAKLMNEVWKGKDGVVRPELFKRILGQYNVTFEGYGQHDSQECINSVLDFLSEDLFKRERKPYVEMDENEGRSDEEASLESWNKYIYRNESIICDLFVG